LFCSSVAPRISIGVLPFRYSGGIGSLLHAFIFGDHGAVDPK
jgi:hypothetical protein